MSLARRLVPMILASTLGACGSALREPPPPPDTTLSLTPAASATAVADRDLFVYLLNDDGGFTPVDGSPFVSGGRVSDVEGLSTIPSRLLLFVANDATDSFSVLGFNLSTGALSPLPGSPYKSEGKAPAETVVSAPYLFVANSLGTNVSSFRLRSDGVPSPLPGSPVATGGDSIEGMAISPNGKLIFVNHANKGRPDTLAVLRVGDDGSLSPAAGSPFPVVSLPDEVVVHPNNRFVYVTNRATPTIAGFSAADDGTLSPLPGSPYPAPPGVASPEHCLLNAEGTLLFYTFEIPAGIASYRVAADGSLSLVSGPVFLETPGPGGPEGMALSPDERFLYLANHIDDRLHAFRIDDAGALTTVFPGGVPIAAEPLDIVIPGWRVGGLAVMVVSTRLR
jgi:6-phosphogluconolactonase (cycloisomerase 2 family)